jgi:hypothetical protein
MQWLGSCDKFEERAMNLNRAMALDWKERPVLALTESSMMRGPGRASSQIRSCSSIGSSGNFLKFGP